MFISTPFQLTFEEALNHCHKNGMKLLTVLDEGENDFIKLFLYETWYFGMNSSLQTILDQKVYWDAPVRRECYNWLKAIDAYNNIFLGTFPPKNLKNVGEAKKKVLGGGGCPGCPPDCTNDQIYDNIYTYYTKLYTYIIPVIL